jgi:hypothetical protein
VKHAHRLTLTIGLTVGLIAATSLMPAVCNADAVTTGTVTAATRTIQNGVAYITGGVGSDEADAMRSVANQYSLRLSFVTQRGQYLSDVDVEIVGPSGDSLLKAHTLGPFLYVSLPPGRYQVAAYAQRTRQMRVVVVNARQGANVQFAFPSPVRRAAAPCCEPPSVAE